MKKQKTNNPFTNLILDEEEKLLEQALKRDEFEDNQDFVKTKIMLKEVATRYTQLNTSKSITIRINQLDLIRVKARAKMKQIPYQTLLGTLIHQYAEGEKSLKL